MTGDASLFARSDEVEKSCSIIDPFVRAWDRDTTPQSRAISQETGALLLAMSGCMNKDKAGLIYALF